MVLMPGVGPPGSRFNNSSVIKIACANIGALVSAACIAAALNAAVASFTARGVVDAAARAPRARTTLAANAGAHRLCKTATNFRLTRAVLAQEGYRILFAAQGESPRFTKSGKQL
jgi:hypothetical protein